MIKKAAASVKDHFRNWDGSLFPIWYFLLTGLSFNSITADRWFMPYLIGATLVYAAARFIISIPQLRRSRPVPLAWCCVAFFVSYAISSLLSVRYGWVGNLKALVWMGLCFFIVYPAAITEQRSPRRVRKRPLGLVFLDCLLVYSGIQALISFGLLIFKYNWYRPVNIYLGFWYGRLWGSYTDPNYGASLAGASIIIALMYIVCNKAPRLVKRLLIPYIALQYLYIVFSYSRGGMIVMAFALVLFYLYWVISQRRGVLRSVLMGLLIALMAVSMGTVRDGYNYLAKLGQEDPDRYKLEREEASVSLELSDGRIAIWKNGLAILKENPLFGVSHRNLLPYMNDRMPDCYMATHNEPLSTCHNALVDVAASQGLVGLFILGGTVVLISVRSLRAWKKMSRGQKDHCMVFGLGAVTILGSAMFISDVFYFNTPTTVAFWFCLGEWMAGISDAGEAPEENAAAAG